MKKYTTLFTLLMVLFFLCGACRKDSTPAAPAKACRLSRISGLPGGDTVDITYSYDGQLYIINRHQGVDFEKRVFTYSGNTITTILSFSNSPGTHVYDTLNVTNDGLILNSHTKTGSGDYFSTNTYSGTQIQTNSYLAVGNYSFNATYTYTNGDLTTSVSTKSGNLPATAHYTYYTDKAYAPGDYFQIYEFLNDDAPHTRSAHLLKSITGNNTTDNYTYTFDKAGNILSQTENNGTTTTTLFFQYDCN